jgi:hypothetical protein
MAPKRNRFVFTVGMVSRLVATAEEDRLRLPAQGRLRPSQFYWPFTSVVQKIALTAIVDQADNSTLRVAGAAFSAGGDGGRRSPEHLTHTSACGGQRLPSLLPHPLRLL